MYAVERRCADLHNTPHLAVKGTEVPAKNGIYADPPNNKLYGLAIATVRLRLLTLLNPALLLPTSYSLNSTKSSAAFRITLTE